jgi:hypothetical protein
MVLSSVSPGRRPTIRNTTCSSPGTSSPPKSNMSVVQIWKGPSCLRPRRAPMAPKVATRFAMTHSPPHWIRQTAGWDGWSKSGSQQFGCRTRGPGKQGKRSQAEKWASASKMQKSSGSNLQPKKSVWACTPAQSAVPLPHRDGGGPMASQRAVNRPAGVVVRQAFQKKRGISRQRQQQPPTRDITFPWCPRKRKRDKVEGSGGMFAPPSAAMTEPRAMERAQLTRCSY